MQVEQVCKEALPDDHEWVVIEQGGVVRVLAVDDFAARVAVAAYSSSSMSAT